MKFNWLRRKWIWLFPLILCMGTVTVTADRYFEISKSMEIFGEVYTEVNKTYVDESSPSQLMRTGIDAMLNRLDPYTNFYSESQIDYSKLIMSGQYSGIGLEVARQEDRFVIMEIKAESPADTAGLRIGDELVQIDDEPISGSSKTQEQVRNLLLGERNSQVMVVVKRSGNLSALSFTITRGTDEGERKDVPYFAMINDTIGYIQLVGFNGNAALEVLTALKELKKDHEVKALVLDLRGNPGGRLDQAVDICNIFVPRGELIVEMRGRTRETQNRFPTRGPAFDTEMPLAVLVNGRSASASEIVAGAIQDLDRGVVIGRRSFGKGLVQNIRPLTYNTQMKITVAKYYTPSGRCIQAIDYFNRLEDGSVGRIPDSLTQEFATRNKRPVFDGGGIQPDIVVAKPPYQAVTQALIDQNLIFGFANVYANTHDTIPSPRDFDIDPPLYREFLSYVSAQGFSFTSVPEQQLAHLKEAAVAQGTDAELAHYFQSLEKQLVAQKAEDLTTYRDEIKFLLREAIIERYYLTNGIIESSFIHDKDILNAVKILANPTAYGKILQPAS